jgi:hypothetical protein
MGPHRKQFVTRLFFCDNSLRYWLARLLRDPLDLHGHFQYWRIHPAKQPRFEWQGDGKK